MSDLPKIIKVGDTITYRGGFGNDPPREAKILDLTVTDEPREKYGKSVRYVKDAQVNKNLVVFGLDDGHWAYSDQIEGYTGF